MKRLIEIFGVFDVSKHQKNKKELRIFLFLILMFTNN